MKFTTVILIERIGEKVKKVISACIDQVIQFDSEQEIDLLLEHLKSRKQRFTIVWKNNLNDGNVQIRIRRQYNQHFMEEGENSE